MNRKRNSLGKFINEGKVFGGGRGKRWRVYCREESVLWSRIVYQNYYLDGKEIPEGYEIHHKDGNHENDNIDNLEMLIKGEHRRLHRLGKVNSEKTRKKISEALKGKPLSLETRKKLSESHKGKKFSDETKMRMSRARKGISRPDISGEKSGRAKLSEEKVKEIRELLKEGMSLRKIADIYGVSFYSIFCIKKERTWKYV
jgi:hypothetical protein